MVRIKQKEMLELFRAVFDTADESIAIFEPETGRCVDVNQRLLDVYGFTREEMLKKKPGSTRPGDAAVNQETALELIRKAAGGEPQKFEWDTQRPNGEVVTLEINLSKIDLGEQTLVLYRGREISEKKSYEKALREADYWLRESQRAAMVGSYILDLKTQQWDCSDTLKLIFGIDDSLPRNVETWVSVLHPADRDEMAKYFFDEVVDKRKPFNRSYRIIRKDSGEEAWVYGLGELIMDANGVPDKMTGTIRDITERKKIEIAAEEKEALLRAVGNNIPDCMIYQMVFENDGSRRFSFVSRGVEKLHELSQESVLADYTLLYGRVVEEDVPGLIEAENESLRTLGVFDEEIRIRMNDGSVRWSRIVAQPRRHASGIIISEGVEMDITDKKNAAEELKKHRDYLEELVNERTMNLQKAQEQLLQAQKMEAIGTLAGGIAHDFNNILATISGSAQIMSKKLPADSDLQKTVSRIISSGTRAKNLTMKLLTFARKEKLELVSLNLNSVVYDVVEMLKGTIPKSIRIYAEYNDAIPDVTADITQLTQALLNVCLNGCDAMADGGTLNLKIVEADLSEEQLSGKTGCEPGRYCGIEISDSGAGIAKENLDKIFEPFFTTKDRGKGSGLGLAVTAGIVKNHSGYIEVDGGDGKGTTFRIMLPLKTVAEERPNVPAPNEEVEGLKKGCALIIDDDKNFVETLKEVLEMEGYSVLYAYGGETGIAEFRKNIDKIDVVILDMIMPETNPSDVFDFIAKNKPECKVIICSGFSVEGKATELLNQGAYAFIQKPFSMSDMLLVTAQALSK